MSAGKSRPLSSCTIRTSGAESLRKRSTCAPRALMELTFQLVIFIFLLPLFSERRYGAWSDSKLSSVACA